MDNPGIRMEPRHWEIVSVILRSRIPGHDVWAFGSRVAGNAKPYSDLDLAVAGDTPVPFPTLALLSADFEESRLPFKVDVVDLASVSRSFRQRIESNCMLVQSADKTRRAAT